MNQSFLGTGWKFPVALEPGSGAFAMSADESDIQEAIRIILFTAKGERVMRPDFGCGIHDFVFETMSVSTAGQMEASVRDALNRWEPRIETLSVEVQPERGAVGKLGIAIRYRVRSTNNEFNLVYPFYLREG
ncbi:GPW/gp25 family protein [Paenibacillus curdlanolyticus YK9]|uniref:GPW/gp25 family protein n=1 Tax=Paenibacillus curdlanolyticus YK9 TaxID=717606 RepID=E0I817_9BACL|nr:GPW/gp25 family protein [Paenibacillus curdlanolyticus]EFM11322.1 GPW/gp25 family protein [Paenibacillus curdlanolyticus YK9]